MFKSKVILFFLLVTLRLSNGQNFLGDSIEFNAPENYDDWEAENIYNDIWDEEDQIFSEQKSTQNMLQMICTDYDLIYIGKLIDCENIKIKHKKLDFTKNHQIGKREVSEDNLEEGSGDDGLEDEDDIAENDNLPSKTQSLSLEPSVETKPEELQKLDAKSEQEPQDVESLDDKQPNLETDKDDLQTVNAVENEKAIQDAQSLITPTQDKQENNDSVDLEQIVPKSEQEKDDDNKSFKTQSLIVPEKPESAPDMPEDDETTKDTLKLESPEEKSPNLQPPQEEKVEDTQNVEAKKLEPNQDESPKVEQTENVQPIEEPKSVDYSVADAQENISSVSSLSEDNIEPKGVESTTANGKQEETIEKSEKEINNNKSSFETQSLKIPETPEASTKLEETSPEEKSQNVEPLREEKIEETQDVESSEKPGPTQEDLPKVEPIDNLQPIQEAKSADAQENNKSSFETQSLNIPEIPESVSKDTHKPEENKEAAPTPKPEEAKTEGAKEEKPKTQEVANPQEPIVETSIKDDKSKSSETAVKVEESKNKKEGQEEINPLQSGIAIFKTNANMEDTDKQLAKSKSNESIKSTATDAEEPKSGASETQETSKKNNTLLFVIFGAVLVVGAAAFGYNFYKKRSNRAVAVSTTANGTSRTDPEEGREMKPLMKSPEENNSVEYKDEK
ncbi:titin-like isoform X2 [Diorhabda carinulata]|uniref:titin-like isoform X2 n=1 Tax=Diorhabda carinulata TaxID=1163345 RepID=UPI0025A1BC64|nr:titin-like isoform X2 [Diorhabda carinulata]